MSDEEDSFEVETIEDWRYNLETGLKEYYIKWQGWDAADNTWEPEEHLNCAGIFKKFRKSLSDKQRAFLDSKHPESLNGLQRNVAIKSITGEIEKGQPSTSNGPLNTDARIILNATFEDNEEQSERIEMDELIELRPDEAFKFIEQRLIDKDVIKK